MKKRHEQKLIIISLGLFVMLSIPIILLFNNIKEVLGFPAIIIYIFSICLISILTSFIIIKRHDE